MSALLHSLADQLRRPEFAAVSDADLLRAHAADHSEAAFEALVDRYGRLVWHWCRRVLGPGPDAEDAFQATFLVMSRRAASIRADAVAGWLHAVSRRLAARTLARRIRRQSAESIAVQARTMTTSQSKGQPTVSELMAALDEEVARLPERYRTPLLLCFWQGMTQSEAARCLGCGAGSIKARLERGRRRLAQRLTKRGFGPQAILLAPAAIVAVPGDLSARTAALALPRAVVPGAVAALVESVAIGTATRLKLSVATVVAAIALTAGVMAKGGRELTLEPQSPAKGGSRAADNPQPPAKVDLYGDPLPDGAIARMGTTQLHHKQPSVAFSGDGKKLIIVDQDGGVCVRDVATMKQIERHRIGFPKPDEKKKICGELSPNGQLLAVGLEDRVILYDVATGKERYRLSVKSASESNCVFAPNSSVLATLARNGNEYSRIRIWDTATGRNLCSVESGKPVSVWSNGAFSQDGKLFATADSAKHLLQLWDATTGKKLREQEVMDQQLDFAPDGKTLAVGGYNGVSIYDIASLKEVAQLPLPSPECITSLKFSRDGALLLGGRQLGDLVVWDVRKRKLKFRLDAVHIDRQRFSPDGKTLAVWGFMRDVVELWDISSGKQLHVRPGHGQWIYALATSPDGSMVASGGMND
jgi:RNA polymerase sigma factor (sigma-70 family)